MSEFKRKQYTFIAICSLFLPNTCAFMNGISTKYQWIQSFNRLQRIDKIVRIKGRILGLPFTREIRCYNQYLSLKCVFINSSGNICLKDSVHIQDGNKVCWQIGSIRAGTVCGS